jgi:hypothetical protein
MNGTRSGSGFYKLLTALMWLTLPAVGLIYASWWQRLPARLATHFDLSNQPNGWMSRGGFLIFLLLFAAGVVALATWITSRVQMPDLAAWTLLLLFYVIAAVVLWAENSVIAYNTTGHPVNVAPVLGAGTSAAVLVTIVALFTRRGPDLHAQIIAKETHASALWAFALLICTVAMTILAYNIPVIAARIAIAIGALLTFGGALMAWSGFDYRFGPEGIEVRTLGFRLRSIPKSEIQSYAAGGWGVLRGYGIRGVGSNRAYVWGNTGVMIQTVDGEIFLGHDHPQRVIRDLDRVMHCGDREGKRTSDI